MQDCQKKLNIPSIRVSFIQKHFVSPAHKELQLTWVTTSWVKHRASATSWRSLPQSCCRQHLSLPHIKPLSLAASSSSLSNKFREGIAAGEFQCSQKACLHKLQIWWRRHHLPGGPHRSSALPVLTISLLVSCSRFGGFTLNQASSKNKHSFTKKHLTDPG